MIKSLTYYFFRVVWRIKSIILLQIALLTAGAVTVHIVEKMPLGESLYFAFVTGLTIGYGDIVVKTFIGRLTALFIGFVGVLFTGLMAAILVLAVRESYEDTNKIDAGDRRANDTDAGD